MKEKILLILFLFFAGITFIPSASATAYNELAAFPFAYDPNTWNTYIDESVKMNVQWVHLLGNPPSKFLITDARLSKPDLLKPRINYARSKGLKVSLLVVDYKYGKDNYNRWYNNANTKKQILDDIQYAIKNYDIDALELEEPFTPGVMAQSPTKVVAYLREIRGLIDTGISNGDIPVDFQFGATMSSNNVNNYLFLRDAIVQGKIFTYLRPEMVYQDVGTGSGFEKNYNNWKTAFPATILDIRPVIYIQWSALKTACIAKGYSGYNHYSCYNQGWFKQIDWAHKNNIGMYIYTVWVPSANSGYFPQDKFPGTNATQKISGILSYLQTSITPTPIVTGTLTPSITPTTDNSSITFWSILMNCFGSLLR